MKLTRTSAWNWWVLTWNWGEFWVGTDEILVLEISLKRPWNWREIISRNCRLLTWNWREFKLKLTSFRSELLTTFCLKLIKTDEISSLELKIVRPWNFCLKLMKVKIRNCQEASLKILTSILIWNWLALVKTDVNFALELKRV